MIVEKKHMLWSLILPWGIAAFTLLLVLLSWAFPQMNAPLLISAIVILLLALFSMLVSMILMTKDIVDSKALSSNAKVLWLLGLWLVLGYFAAVLYYILVKRKSPRNP
jgi:hypothetical protein